MLESTLPINPKIPIPKHNATTAPTVAGLFDTPRLVPVCAEVGAETEAEPVAGSPAVDSVVIAALVRKDGAMGVELEPAEEEVPVAVAIAILVVVSVDTLPAV